MDERELEAWKRQAAEATAAARARWTAPGDDPIAPGVTEEEHLSLLLPTGGGGFSRIGETLGEKQTFGTPGERTCPHCGARIEKTTRAITPKLSVWAWPDHGCPGELAEREALRLDRQERELRARRELLAMRANPTPERSRSIRQIVHLPHWTPDGMERVRADECPAPFVAAVRRHRDQWIAGQRPPLGLWFVGPTGCRKTCLLAALAFEVANWTNLRPLYWDWADLIDQLRRGYGDGETEWDRPRADFAPILVLDDIGTTRMTETARELIFTLINAATNACGEAGPRQTLYLATNEGPDVLGERLKTEDQPAVGDRIVRRLVQHCEVVEVGQ